MMKMIMMTVKAFIPLPSDSSALWPITNTALVNEDNNLWGKEQRQENKTITYILLEIKS